MIFRSKVIPHTSNVHPDVAQHLNDIPWWLSRVSLTTKNVNVDALNLDVLDRFPGGRIICTSADALADHNDAIRIPVEHLNYLNPVGLPPHRYVQCYKGCFTFSSECM